MQKFKLFLISLSLIAISPISTVAQKVGIGGTMGVRSDFNVKAKGFAQSIYIYNRFTDKFSIKCGLGHAMSESQSAIYQSGSSNTLIRNKNQPVPIEDTGFFGWDNSAFPNIDISDKGNRYDDLFVYLALNYKIIQKHRHFGQIGAGTSLHRRDHSEQIGSIIAAEAHFPIGIGNVNDLEIPVFAYNTFLDYSIIAEGTYGFILTESLDILLESNLFFYPKSKTMSLNIGLGFNIDF
ncbi:MAG: hypothetical protein R3D00_25080 [Bacteroidia bacterium]